MTSRSLNYARLCLVFSAITSTVAAADPTEPPSVAKTMVFLPIQKDVEIETPKPSEFAKCKVEAERKGKSVGWMVLGPSGQVLRKFLDTDSDGKIDQFRYYNLGIEVYRDIDTNKNEKIDQYRWLNRGGSRWGIDKNEDGRIDQWKVLSATEASREAIRAMTSQDAIALQAVLVTADDLKSLGVIPQLAERLLESASEPDKKSKDVMKKSKIFTSQSTWARFEAQLPSIIPVEDEKAKEDIQVYESAYAIIETPKKDGTKKSDAVQIGEMIRIGEVWKLTQVPLPLEGEMTTSPILLEPLNSAPSNEGNSPAPSPKLQKILAELQEIDQKVMQPNQSEKQVKSMINKRSALFKEAIELADSNDEKNSLYKQNIDLLAIAAQAGNYPDGAKDLLVLEAEFAKQKSDSPLLPYTVYRRMQAENSLNLAAAAANRAKMAAVLKQWMQSLEEFVTKYPNADDTDDAIWTLGNQEEFQGQTNEAIAWYKKLVKDKPKSNLFARAQGAIRRLELEDKPLTLDGPLLSGGVLNSKKDLKGQVYLVVFWNSMFKANEEDIPQLRALYGEYHDKRFEIVGVALEADKKVAQDYVTANKMSWPQIFQPDPQNLGGMECPIAMNFGIISLPTMFLVNADGIVVSRNTNLTEVKTELPSLLNLKKK